MKVSAVSPRARAWFHISKSMKVSQTPMTNSAAAETASPGVGNLALVALFELPPLLAP
jgi:hypothetical protein